jgi:hypothetical protein
MQPNEHVVLMRSLVVRLSSRACRICEDVAQTYHDVYQCAGNDVDAWGPGNDPLFSACEQPKFACEKLTGDLAQACQAMETELYEDDDKARTLWMAQMEFGSSYGTCVKLGRCEVDPAPEEHEYTPCHQVFKSEEGKNDFLHAGFTSNCTEECYLCNWLVREWPLFQEICVPDGTHMANSIDPDRTVVKDTAMGKLKVLDQAKVANEAEQAAEEEAAAASASAADEANGDAEASFVERGYGSNNARWQQHGADEPLGFVETGVKVSSMQRAWAKHTNKAIQGVLQHQSSARIVPRARNEDLMFSEIHDEETAGEAGPVLSGTDLKKDCFTMWRYFAKSRKAKFFASWKRTIGIEVTPADVERSNMWDANVACKCLGQCGLDAFEHLGLISQCRYDDRDRLMMEFAFPNPH